MTNKSYINTPPIFVSSFMSHMQRICWLTSHSDTSPREETLSIDELAKRFLAPDTRRGQLSQSEYHALDKKVPNQAKQRKAEKNGAAFIASTFIAPDVRTKEFVQELTGFTLDFDGGVGRVEIETKLAGFGYLAYTSYSHLPHDERWRVLIPYATPCSVSQHSSVYAYFHGMFNGRMDSRSATTNQLWYTPACPHDAVDQFVSFVHDAQIFDPYSVTVPAQPNSSEVKATATPNSSVAALPVMPMAAILPSEYVRLMNALTFVDADDRENWIKVGMALKNQLGDDALPMWLQWSKSSSKFDDGDAITTWDGFKLVTGGVKLGTIFHLAQSGGWSNTLTNQQQVPVTTVISPLFDINDAKVHRFVQNPAPKRRWLLSNTLPLGKVGMLVAPGGTGKSFFAIQLAVAVATRSRFADHWNVDEDGASLILCAEEDDDDLHHRLLDVLAVTVGQSAANLKLIEERVHIKSMLTENNLMTHANDRREIVPTDYVDRLILTAKQIPNLRLIVIDPASRFRGGDEIAAQDTTRFVEVLERLRSATGATVLLVHHTNKGSMNAEDVTQAAARGSSALTDGVRWQMNINKLTKPQAKDHGIPETDRDKYVLATITKNNGAPPQPPVVLLRGPGGVLGAAAPSTPKLSPELKVIALIETEAAAGRNYTSNRLEMKFSGTAGKLGLSASALRKLISACLQLKYLRKRIVKPVGILETTGTMPA